MAAIRGVWAIDIGSNSLKALRLREGDEGLEVIGFGYVEHSAILSAGNMDEVEKQQILDETLRTFLSQHEIGKEEVAISIAGQNSFARFIKLPPVEPKKIPEVVQFEAVQQIPFDINEVEWDWQIMDNPDSPDTEVGIFAIKNELIAEVMDHFTQENLRVSCVQISPMALYNYALYDRTEIAESAKKAVVIMDMGAENTTLVVCTRDAVWQRSIRIGGNTFTQAIADAFKQPFFKAEKLKRTAPVSKYMRQIYTAMKPVYTELSGEIQRSLGFFTSSPQGRDKTFTHLIAIGGGMKLQGLSKYLQQSLGMTVVKPDSFDRLKLSSEVSTAKFHENVSDFAVVYGLGVQLLGQARIKTNLLPRKIARQMTWTRKAKLFTVAAGVLLLVMLLGLVRAFSDLKKYESQAAVRREVEAAISQVEAVRREVSEQEGRRQPLLDMIAKHKDVFKHRDVVPKLNEVIVRCLPNAENTPAQAALYEAFAAGNTAEVMKTPRSQRKQLFISRLMIEAAADVAMAGFPTPDTTGSRTARTAGPARDGGMMMPGGMPGMPMMPGMPGMDMGMGMGTGMGSAPSGEGQASGEMGFTVLIEGYSPYERISELLDPPGVGGNRARWGVITRFENLKQLFPDAAFELFKKSDITHFKVETGRVDLSSGLTPAGIGVVKEIQRVPQEQTDAAAGAAGRLTAGTRGQDIITVETVLVDPMTQEEISRTYDIYTQDDIARDPSLKSTDLGRKKYTPFGEEKFIDRDQWFRIYAKFAWKNPDNAPTDGQMPQ